MGWVQREIQHGVGPGQGWVAVSDGPCGVSYVGATWGQTQGACAHLSALYLLVPGMPAPCTTAGLSVVAALRAFIALSFLL